MEGEKIHCQATIDGPDGHLDRAIMADHRQAARARWKPYASIVPVCQAVTATSMPYAYCFTC